MQGSDGNFYGTTVSGGASYMVRIGTPTGTVFRATPGGALTTLYSFSGAGEGGSPMGLIQATDGDFYGTTYAGGVTANGGSGTILKITAGGTLTTLHRFNGTDGRNPYGVLVQANDGNFYGTTSVGGDKGNGTIFKITSWGILTTLHSFTAGKDGYFPEAGLIQATDGNLYGTTGGGGCSTGCSTVFKITLTGTLTTLYNFSGGADGSDPKASLVQGTDGNFYGTTSLRGASNAGTVFKITPGGTLTTLYTFSGRTDGAAPSAGLIQATDGNFYGTAPLGGANGLGTVFKITPGGALSTLYSFSGRTDGSPAAESRADSGNRR